MKKILATDLRYELLASFNLKWGQKTVTKQRILDAVFSSICLNVTTMFD